MCRIIFLISVVLVVVLAACGRADQPTAATIIAPPTAPGTQGWLLCLSTDRPIYHPGDTVNGRVVILDAVTFAPATTRIPVNLRLLNSRDHVTATSLAWSVDGIAPFTWTLTADAVEGGYRVTADAATPSAPAERALIVTTERTPALDLQLRQEREAWAPGETANVRLSVRHHDGTPVSAATVRINATVDGVVIDLTAMALDAVGETTLRIPLPATFSSGVLTAIIDDHGHLEQVSCQLRRVTKPLVELIPESGALLSGMPNVIYLQAWRRAGEPLALRGDVIDDQQRVVTEIRTTHEGRARVIFTPHSGRQYRLLVRDPSAVDNLHPLPAVHDHGVVLHARDERIAADQPARLDLTSTTIGLHRVELTRRGAAVASIVVPCSPRVTQALELPLPADVDGVLEATVSGPDGTRLAQRLLFREPKRRLTVTVVPDQARRGLDEDAGVTVRVVDEHGRPAAALVSVAVVDAGTTTSLPPRERAPRLPVMALLENEVEYCADPAAYLGDAQALDLLLGAQAWRRLVDPRSPPPATTPTRELALRRLLMQRHVWPEWPAMLAADSTAPVPGLSSRHHGLPAQPSTPSTPLPPVKPSGGATDWALNWMMRMQRADGSWSPNHPAEEIRRDAERTGIAPWSGPDADRAATALMLLCYFNAGYDHKTPNKYKKHVAQGLAWLMTQAPDGRFSHDATVQGVVTCCLAEAYAMTNDAALRPLCELAIAAVLADQVQWQGQRLGWSATTANAPICDADASMWCVTALQSALAGGLAIGDGMQGAKVYLTAAWTAANAGRTVNETAKLGTFPTRWDPRINTCQLPHSPANGLVMAVFLGFHSGDALTDGLAEHVFCRYYPPQLPLPLIEDYRTTLGLFLVGGDYWDQWDRMHRDLMVNLQDDRIGSDVGTHHLRGSWDPQDFDAFAATGGRVITSAFACLSMEIYYRYRAINSKVADVKENTLAAPAPHELDAGTRLWNAAARTDPLTGNATLRFTTPARPADLRILVDAVDARGALGSGDGLMRCGAEVTLDARLPQHLRVEADRRR